MISEKHIQVTGYSNISWKDAIIKTINEASQTISDLCTVTVLEQRAHISENKLVEYMVDLDIAFRIIPCSDTSEKNSDNM